MRRLLVGLGLFVRSLDGSGLTSIVAPRKAMFAELQKRKQPETSAAPNGYRNLRAL